MLKYIIALLMLLFCAPVFAAVTLTINGTVYNITDGTNIVVTGTLPTTTGGSAPPVLGVCGSNGALSTVPSGSQLCTVGNPNPSALSGAGPFTWTCSSTGGANPASCSASLSSAGTPPTTSGSCTTADPTQVFSTGAGDTLWSPMGAVLFPSPPARASGLAGRAIQFAPPATAGDGTARIGIVINTFDDFGGALPKTVVISTCPHDFDRPVGSTSLQQAACRSDGNISGQSINLLYSGGTTKPRWNDCIVQSGATYYINLRNYVTSGTPGTVHAQFGMNGR